MDPIKIHVASADIEVIHAPKLTAGMVGLPVEITYDASWDGLGKHALFRAGGVKKMKPNIENTVSVSAEVMKMQGFELEIGIFGTKEDGTQLPTIWACVGTIREGTCEAAEEEADPEQPVWAQALKELSLVDEKIEDALQESKENGDFDGPKGDPGVGKDTPEGGQILNNLARNQADKHGLAVNDDTQAGWRGLASGFNTYAKNTGLAGGRLTQVTGKGSIGVGIELMKELKVGTTNVVTAAATPIDSVTIRVNVSVSGVLKVGDFIHLSGSGMITTDCRRVAAISSDGKTITIKYPFEDVNYDTAIPGSQRADIPAGANVRLDIPTTVDGDGGAGFGKGNRLTGESGFVSGEENVVTQKAGSGEGLKTKNYSVAGHTEGFNTQAGLNPDDPEISGNPDTSCAHAEGNNTKALVFATHAEGRGTIAGSSAQHTEGRYNIPDYAGKYQHITGNGKSDTERSNSYTRDWNGNGWYAGDVYVGGAGQEDPAAEKLVKASELGIYAKASDMKMKLVATGALNPNNQAQIRLSKSLEINKNYMILFKYGYSSCVAHLNTYNGVTGVYTSAIVLVAGTTVIHHGCGALVSNLIDFRFMNGNTASQNAVVPQFSEFKVYELPY